MGWAAVWQLALKQFGAEAVEIRILIMLAAALGATLILVGIKHAFRPAGPQAAPPPPDLPKRMFAAPSAVAATVVVTPEVQKASAQPFRVRKPVIRTTRKCAKHTVSSHVALRPQIRRAVVDTTGK